MVDAGRSDYEIVCASDANATTNLAAKELQQYVRRATGVTLPIVAQASAEKGRLFLGPDWLPKAGVSPTALKPELVPLGTKRGTSVPSASLM